MNDTVKEKVNEKPVPIYYLPLGIIFQIHVLNPSHVPYEGDTIFCLLQNEEIKT